MTASLLRVRDLHVAYRTRAGEREVVHGVDLDVSPGELVAVVGESGSGKTTLAHSIIGLLPGTGRVTAGRTELEGIELTGLPERAMDRVRGARIGLVPQDPGMSLNPVKPVGHQVAEALVLHGLATRAVARERAVETLALAGLPEPQVRARQFPHQLSGGMRQRVLIAIALVCQPALVIADEPTSALDVTVQRKVLDHLTHATRSTGTAVLFITHDLAVAADRADRVLVMKDGLVVEHGAASQILLTPEHPYTRGLIAAAPSLTSARLVAPRAPEPATERASVPVLELRDIVKDYPLPGRQTLRAVSGVSVRVARGRTYSLVGESGSGKSTTARIAMRLERPTAGAVLLGGADVTELRGAALRRLRARMQIVYQNPYASLDPRWSVGRIVAEPLAAFGVGNGRDRRSRVRELLDHVTLPADVVSRRPGELSGGQRQRVAIARALALRPDLVILDEPVSALDVSVQAQILELLVELQRELGLSYLFISHDLAVVRQISDDVGVMRDGHLVEEGPVEAVFARPQHAYTHELIEAIPGRALS